MYARIQGLGWELERSTCLQVIIHISLLWADVHLFYFTRAPWLCDRIRQTMPD